MSEAKASDFRPGDLVVCVRAEDQRALKNGHAYIVRQIELEEKGKGTGFVYIEADEEGDSGGFFPHRFVKINF